MSKEILKSMLDDCFNHLGVEAIYVSQEGIAINITVLRRIPDQVYDFGDNVMVTPSCEFEIRIDEIGRSLAGDKIIVDEIEYVIHGEPVRDNLQQVWKIEAIEHGASD